MIKIISQSDKQTEAFGFKLGRTCIGGEIFALSGDLGAGKTCLSQGIAKGLGLKTKVNSPTFVIMKMYKVSGHKSVKHLCHIDAYRLSTAKELEAIGALDYFKQPDTVTIIEWPEKIKTVLPKKAIRIDLKINHNRLSERVLTKK